MKKRIFIFLIVLALFFLVLSSKLVLSQETEATFKDYIFSASTYQSDLEKFILARGKYLNFKSISSEAEAVFAAKSLLNSKISFISKYLAALKSKLALETKINGYQENLLYLQLDSEISSLLNTKELVSGSLTLSDLDKIDLELGEKYKNVQKLSFKTLGIISCRQIINLITQVSDQVVLLEGQLEPSSDLEFNSEVVKRRLTEIKQEIAAQNKKINELERMFSETVGSNEEPKKVFNDLNGNLSKIKLTILSWFPNLEEILVLISREK